MTGNRTVAAGVAASGVMGLAALAGRYAAGVTRASRAWPVQVEAGLRDLGEVDEVSILPVVERLVPEGSGLAGEPGVSYLVRAGGTRVLFDSGLSGGKPESALAHNAQILGMPLGDLDAVVISHLHADHVGGLAAMRHRTFSFSADPLEPRGVPAHVPTEMQHPRADVAVTTGPRVIGPGMAVLPPCRACCSESDTSPNMAALSCRAGMKSPDHPGRASSDCLTPARVASTPAPSATFC